MHVAVISSLHLGTGWGGRGPPGQRRLFLHAAEYSIPVADLGSSGGLKSRFIRRNVATPQGFVHRFEKQKRFECFVIVGRDRYRPLPLVW